MIFKINNMLNQEIIDFIGSDDSFNEQQEQRIKNTFYQATRAEKDKINEIFIALCGYSLETILIERQ